MSRAAGLQDRGHSRPVRMSVRLRRWVRRCATLAAPVALAGTLGGVAEERPSFSVGGESPSVASTGPLDSSYLRVGATEFAPLNSGDGYSRPQGRLYATEGSGTFGATPHLPNGAVLSSL